MIAFPKLLKTAIALYLYNRPLEEIIFSPLFKGGWGGSNRALSLQMFPIGSAIATIVFCGASSLSFIANF